LDIFPFQVGYFLFQLLDLAKEGIDPVFMVGDLHHQFTDFENVGNIFLPHLCYYFPQFAFCFGF